MGQINFAGRCGLQMPLENITLPDSAVCTENNPYLAKVCGLQVLQMDVPFPDSATSIENYPYLANIATVTIWQ